MAWKPLQTGIHLSTKSILELQEKILNEGQDYLLTARFSQDKCENLFSCIRAKRKAPTQLEFKTSLKKCDFGLLLKRSQEWKLSV